MCSVDHPSGVACDKVNHFMVAVRQGGFNEKKTKPLPCLQTSQDPIRKANSCSLTE